MKHQLTFYGLSLGILGVLASIIGLVISTYMPKQAITPSLAAPTALVRVQTITMATASGEVYTLFGQIKAWLQQDPDALVQVENTLTLARVEDNDTRRRMSLLYGALAESTNPEAGLALVKLLGQRLSESAVIQAAAALGDQIHPPNAALDALWQEVQQPLSEASRNVSLLAFGSVAHHLDSDRSDATTRLLSLVSQSNGSLADIEVLAAMGNHGSTAYLPYIRNAAANPSPQIRGAALYALRFLPSAELRDWLAVTAAADASNDVKAEAVRSLRVLSRDAMDVRRLTMVARSSTDADVQLQVARILKTSCEEVDRSLRNLALGEIAQHTLFDSVREFIGDGQRVPVKSH